MASGKKRDRARVSAVRKGRPVGGQSTTRREPPQPKDIAKLKLRQLRPAFSPRGPQHLLMKELALAYGLRRRADGTIDPSDNASFEAAWDVAHVWRSLSKSFDFKKKDKMIQRYIGKSMHQPVEQAFSNIKRIVAGANGINQDGYRQVGARPWSGKYVIFSDHHRATSQERQNFFEKNRELYVDAIEAYGQNGYTVVENGDTEELFVQRYSKNEYKSWLDMTFDELHQRRAALRLRTLKRILGAAENARLYSALGELSRNGQLLRIIGNHDMELQRPEFLEVLRKKMPDLPLPLDFLLLGQGQDNRSPVKMVITHGHHFDEYTNPSNAPYLGELISETISWAFQGADRNWAWRKDGGNVGQWLDGSSPFNNKLVTAQHANLDLLAFFAHEDADEAERALEGLLQKNVAWEYFLNANPWAAFTKEVAKGKAFFKFRHMDEINIMNGWNKTFPQPERRPQLLLGHSHEVRLKPHIPGTRSRYDYLLNSGAAGRFENLIWGIEVDQGQARVIAWSHSQRIAKKGARRYVYRVAAKGLLPTEQPL